MYGRELLSTAGISLAVSSLVVLFNNYFLYRHCCPKAQSVAQPVIQPVIQPVAQPVIQPVAQPVIQQAERSTK